MRVIFEKSTPGRRGVGFPPSDVPSEANHEYTNGLGSV